MLTVLDRLRAERERALMQLRRTQERLRKINAAMVAEKLRHVAPCNDGGQMNEEAIGEAAS